MYVRTYVHRCVRTYVRTYEHMDVECVRQSLVYKQLIWNQFSRYWHLRTTCSLVKHTDQLWSEVRKLDTWTFDDFAEYKGRLLDHRTAAPAQSTSGAPLAMYVTGGTDQAVLTSDQTAGYNETEHHLTTHKHTTTSSHLTTHTNTHHYLLPSHYVHTQTHNTTSSHLPTHTNTHHYLLPSPYTHKHTPLPPPISLHTQTHTTTSSHLPTHTNTHHYLLPYAATYVCCVQICSK